MAPEVFSLRPYRPHAADIWSCGVVLFVLLVGVYPYELPHPSDQRFELVYSGRIVELLEAWGALPRVPPGALDLLGRMLAPLERRITMAELIHHPYLN